ncbi:hypothetical protein Tco_1236076 [Tanacetum coccineum]
METRRAKIKEWHCEEIKLLSYHKYSPDRPHRIAAAAPYHIISPTRVSVAMHAACTFMSRHKSPNPPPADSPANRVITITPPPLLPRQPPPSHHCHLYPSSPFLSSPPPTHHLATIDCHLRPPIADPPSPSSPSSNHYHVEATFTITTTTSSPSRHQDHLVITSFRPPRYLFQPLPSPWRAVGSGSVTTSAENTYTTSKNLVFLA